MVLQDASIADENVSFQDSAPSSDGDQYSDSAPRGSIQVHITADMTNWPKPIPVIGRLLGFNEDLFSKMMAAKFTAMEALVQRKLTEEEINTMAYYGAKKMAIYSYGTPIGVAGAAWRCYATSNTFRFPFWQPNLETFRGHEFPPYYTIFRGARAAASWHSLRFVAYGVVGNFIGRTLFGSYAASVGTVGEFKDKRLKDFHDTARKRMAGAKGQATSPQKLPNSPSNVSEDDASPTGGYFGSEGASQNADQESVASTTRTEPRRRWPVVKAEPAPSGIQESSDRPFAMFDDASPPGDQGIGADTSSVSSVSAWERLRRGQKPDQNGQSRQQNGSTKREPGQSSTTGDSFAFSKSEEEKSYAKEEAQKEFDARVERERRGGDFAQGIGDRKRW